MLNPWLSLPPCTSCCPVFLEIMEMRLGLGGGGWGSWGFLQLPGAEEGTGKWDQDGPLPECPWQDPLLPIQLLRQPCEGGVLTTSQNGGAQRLSDPAQGV